MSWTRALLALTMVIAPALTACTGGADAGSRPGPAQSSPADPRWDSCQTATASSGPRPPAFDADPGDLPRLPGGFAATAAVVCGVDTQDRPDGSQHSITTEDRAGDVARLVAALRLPDEPRTGQPCGQAHASIAWFVLLDAQGRWLRPGVPRDECTQYRTEVRAAVKGLRLTRVATWPGRQIRSAEAAAAGCSQDWGNVVPVHATAGSWATAAGPLFGDRSRVRLCVYRVPADEQHSTKPIGDFHYGGLLPAERSAAIDTAVRHAPRADPACTKPTSQFAVLYAPRGNEPVYVELDGCRRVSVTRINALPSLQQATPAVLAMLARSG